MTIEIKVAKLTHDDRDYVIVFTRDGKDYEGALFSPLHPKFDKVVEVYETFYIEEDRPEIDILADVFKSYLELSKKYTKCFKSTLKSMIYWSWINGFSKYDYFPGQDHFNTFVNKIGCVDQIFI